MIIRKRQLVVIVWEMYLLLTPTFEGHVHGLLTATLKQPVKNNYFVSK